MDLGALTNYGTALKENAFQSMQSLLKFASEKNIELDDILDEAQREVLNAGSLTTEVAGLFFPRFCSNS
jgi:hypothetical protein